MRNLKRALSLAVASVMLLGMMVVGSGASYVDVSSEDNVEAIEVLQAVGVMTGDDQGNFNPDQQVTRGEMAVIMTNLLDLGIGSYAGASLPFTDVPEWAHAYVAAIYANGVTGGTSATTYGTDEPVTAVQAGLMMMKALGYFQYSGDFNDNWILATVTQASRINLFDGLDVETEQALTRNEVAQLALNALEAGMVDFTGDLGLNVDMGNGQSVNAGYRSEYSYRTGTGDRYHALGDSKTDNGDYILQLGEDLYSGDLEKTTDADDFNRPGTRWVYDNKEIGVYSEDPEGVFTAGVSPDEIYDLLGRTISNYDLYVYVNGDGGKESDKDTYIKNGDTDDIAATGRGVLTQVYVTDVDEDDDDEIVITMINTYVAQVDGGYDEDDEELVLADVDGAVAIPAGVETTLSSDDFDNLDAYEDEDYVLITVVGNEVKTIQLAETVTGNVDAFTNTKNVTVDGNKYQYTKGYTGASYTLNSDYDLVLDAYGYVIFADGVEADNDYVYITDTAPVGGVDTTWEAKAFFVDGSSATIEIDNADDLSWENKGDGKDSWYAYDENNDGTYDLEATSDDVSDSKSGEIVSDGTTRITLDGEVVRLNNDTVFIVRRDSKVNTYTGIRSVPTVTASSAITVAAIVDDNGYADYLFVNGTEDDVTVSGSAADDRIYILDTDYETREDADENEYYVYQAIVNGEVGTVNMAKKGLDIGLYDSVTYDSDGYADAKLVEDSKGDTLKVWNVNSTIAYSAGVIAFANTDLALADEYVIYVNDDGEAKEVTPSRLARDYEDEAFVGVISAVYDDDEVIEVYVDEYSNVVAEKTEEEVQENVSDALVSTDGAWGSTGEDNDGTYKPAGEWDSTGSDVTATFENGADATVIMNDTARFLGSLYRNGNAKEIVYDGVTYVWGPKEDGSYLKGSNWFDADDDYLVGDSNTLVAALQDASKFGDSQSITLTVDGVDITISFTVEA